MRYSGGKYLPPEESAGIGDVAKLADHSIASLRQRNAINAPLVKFGLVAINSIRTGTYRRCYRRLQILPDWQFANLQVPRAPTRHRFSELRIDMLERRKSGILKLKVTDWFSAAVPQFSSQTAES